MGDRLVGYSARTLEDLVTAKAELEGRLEESRRQVARLREENDRLALLLGAKSTEADRIWIEENERLRGALADAIEEMEDMVAYVPDYLREKWEYDAAIAKAKAALGSAQSDGNGRG